MCDTLVALPSATADGSLLFAKNSDREPNEAQGIACFAACDYPTGAVLECTYIRIPQARHTHAVLLSRPFWMWGAEMGANEHDVVIGNEALFTRVAAPRTGLTGMDLLRLGLERASCAREALEVITDLLRVHGQGGSGGYRQAFYYHNSFLIAGRDGAWVLETVGREWAARRVAGVDSISNAITTHRDFDRASEGLVADTVRRRLSRRPEDFDFAACYSEALHTHFSESRARREATGACLEAGPEELSPARLMAALRGHGRGEPIPPLGSNGGVCMHYADDLIRINQTTASMVAQLRSDGSATYWLTGTAAPCLSIFKPFYLDAFIPDPRLQPGAQYDASTLWWQGERLHRAVLAHYAARYACIAPTRDGLEADFLRLEAALHASGAGPAERGAFSLRCLDRAQQATGEWVAAVESTAARARPPLLYRYSWQRQSWAAGMPENAPLAR